MRQVTHPPSALASVVFDLLHPVPFGFFVGALIFDVVYAKSAEVLWFKSAAWLISIGLVFAVLPRLINLVRVWITGGGIVNRSREKAAFFLNLLAIVAAIMNAFVHSRDAYSIVAEGVWLSGVTVALMVVAQVLLTLQPVQIRGQA